MKNNLERQETYRQKQKSQLPDNQVIGLAYGRDTRIRTWDPLLPKQVRYRTALHPEGRIGRDSNPGYRVTRTSV